MRKKGIHVFILGTIEDKDSIPRLTPIDRIIEKFIVDKGQPLIILEYEIIIIYWYKIWS